MASKMRFEAAHGDADNCGVLLSTSAVFCLFPVSFGRARLRIIPLERKPRLMKLARRALLFMAR